MTKPLKCVADGCQRPRLGYSNYCKEHANAAKSVLKVVGDWKRMMERPDIATVRNSSISRQVTKNIISPFKSNKK